MTFTRSRLARRLFVVGMAQIAALFVLVPTLKQPPEVPQLAAQARYLVSNLVPLLDDEVALQKAMARAATELDAGIALYFRDGTLRLAAGRAVPVLDAANQARALRGEAFALGPPSWLAVAPLRSEGALVGYGLLLQPMTFAITTADTLLLLALIALVVGLGTWLLARTLTRPLATMTATAQSLGDGNLGARMGLRRDDELGALSQAFDAMAERLGTLVRQQRELLANVSHELRTPLARIHVALDIAAEAPGSDAELLADANTDLQELEQLVADLLTASRLDLDTASAGVPAVAVRWATVDVASLAEKAAARFRRAYPGHLLEMTVAGEGAAIEGDKGLLQRVIDNLLDNAGKYADAGTRVGLRLTCDTAGLRGEVIDAGMGIDAEDLPRLFTPFFRTDRSRARTTGGCGLGLALSRAIVQAHGGTLQLSSAPGRGTTVVFTLPAVPPSGR